MSAPELKPCPICGSPANISLRSATNIVIYCTNEDCCVHDNTWENAIDKWNAFSENTALKAQYENICKRLGIALEANVDEAIAEHTAMKAEIERLRDALSNLVKANEDWNEAVRKIIPNRPLWSDAYLDQAKAALEGK